MTEEELQKTSVKDLWRLARETVERGKKSAVYRMPKEALIALLMEKTPESESGPPKKVFDELVLPQESADSSQTKATRRYKFTIESLNRQAEAVITMDKAGLTFRRPKVKGKICLPWEQILNLLIPATPQCHDANRTVEMWLANPYY